MIVDPLRKQLTMTSKETILGKKWAGFERGGITVVFGAEEAYGNPVVEGATIGMQKKRKAVECKYFS